LSISAVDVKQFLVAAQQSRRQLIYTLKDLMENGLDNWRAFNKTYSSSDDIDIPVIIAGRFFV
jgi:hypothetical protein